MHRNVKLSVVDMTSSVPVLTCLFGKGHMLAISGCSKSDLQQRPVAHLVKTRVCRVLNSCPSFTKSRVPVLFF